MLRNKTCSSLFEISRPRKIKFLTSSMTFELTYSFNSSCQPTYRLISQLSHRSLSRRLYIFFIGCFNQKSNLFHRDHVSTVMLS
ncbi:Bgt-20592 [Blumeria graminis f. sp. tritici]|uniref:Bgt-20592 n=2 Tax=Blumeria graminis f. sp. tritici TaxID=62690 RepID=A0A381L305_BLUGR|nr:Bgt-20592 [Blumeria graminis f. sp. tritici]